MEVSLERVQFKFASIIGELCSKPVVLSQFAVWVDLRLSEYKLKGSFSLDCSGETPDPGWMKGIKSALLAQKLLANLNATKPAGHGYAGSPSRIGGQSRAGRSPASRPNRVPTSQQQVVRLDEESLSGEMLEDSSMHNMNSSQSQEPVRLSPDIVIKEEPSSDHGDGVYPISLHVHEKDKVPRKRTAAETITSESDPDIYHESSTSKIRRSLISSSQHETPSNESLMSIIGLGDQSQDDDESISVENINSDIDFIMAAEIAQNAKQELGQINPNSTAMGSGGPDFVPSPGTSISQEGSTSRNVPEPSPEICMTMMTDRSNRLQGLSSTSRCHINAFERWIQADPHRDGRGIEEIPPTELDDYLSNFFLAVKSQSGGNFTRKSLQRLRVSLERFLKDKGYPISITTSLQFKKSQLAFKQKLFSLETSGINPP